MKSYAIRVTVGRRNKCITLKPTFKFLYIITFIIFIILFLCVIVLGLYYYICIKRFIVGTITSNIEILSKENYVLIF